MTLVSIKLSNFERYYGSETRVDIIANIPCVICQYLPCENVHVISKGAGGDWTKIVPMCSKHHRELHQIGIITFQEKHAVDLLKLAAEFAGEKP